MAKRSKRARAAGAEGEKRSRRAGRGKATRGSGSGLREKGDTHYPCFVEEVKSTDRSQQTVTETMLAKVEQEARAEGKLPAFTINFLQPTKVSNKTWVAVPLAVAQHLLRAQSIDPSILEDVEFSE